MYYEDMVQVESKINQIKARLKQLEREKHALESELERLKRVKHHYKRLYKKEADINEALVQTKQVGP